MAKGLGRGLGALMAEAEGFHDEIPQERNSVQNQVEGVRILKLPEGITTDESGTLWVNPAKLRSNPHQPRTYFDKEELSELTESVRREGVLSPVIIEDAGDGTFFIIAGERRTRAAIAAGIERIPVQLRKYSDERKLEVALIENVQRTDLNPIEEAHAYSSLMEIGNLTQDQVAEHVGKNRSTVANCLRLLRLPEDIQRALVEGGITPGHARALLTLNKADDMRLLFAKITEQGLSVRQSESEAKDIRQRMEKGPSVSKPAQNTRDPNFVALEQGMIEALGTKVTLKGDFDKGSIVIDYFTREDLDRLFSLIAPNASL